METIEKVKEYLNKNSKAVFVIMLVLIVLSVLFSIYQGLTHKTEQFKIQDLKKDAVEGFDNEIGVFESSKRKYDLLKEKDRQIETLLNKEQLTKEDSITIQTIINEIKNLQQ